MLILLVALLLEVGYFLELVQIALLVLLHQAVDFISSAGIPVEIEGESKIMGQFACLFKRKAQAGRVPD